MKIERLIVFLSLGLLLSPSPSIRCSRVLPTYAIVNCKIVSLSRPPLDNGVIIIRNGLIEALGPQEKIAIPEDAEVIDAKGLMAYPGLIDAHTNLFIEVPKEEIPTAPPQLGGQQAERRGQNPDLMVLKLLKPKKSVLDSYHRIGITTVLVAPERGIFAGQSVLLNLNGESTEPMVIKNPFALHITFSTERGVYPSSLMGTMAYLRQSFLDAEYYASCNLQFSKILRGIKRPQYNPFLEGLVPFVMGKKPVVIHCNNQEDIKRGLRLIDEFKLNALISGANEAWRVAHLLKIKSLPLLITLNFKPPASSIYVNQGEELKKKAEKEIYPANASNLFKEGIKFALTSFGISDTANVMRNIQEAIKAGLPKEEALKALTLYPAQFLGIQPLLGSLEPGKIANIILTSGEIFEEKTQVEKVFVDGILFKVEKPPAEEKPAALDVSGLWKATVSGPMGEIEMTVEIVQEKSRFTGTITSDLGKWEIQDGALSGNEVRFTFVATIMGETMDLAFTGKVTRDSIEGEVSFAGGKAELKAVRIPKEQL